MNLFRNYTIYMLTFFATILMSCKKDDDTHPKTPQNYCQFYSIVSSDTNYMPHKKGNSWQYCSGSIDVADWSGGIILDTIINNKISFTRRFSTYSSHVFVHVFEAKSIIDTLGNYYEISTQSGYFDTLLMLKPNAVNGDTIYNNLVTNVKVVLINKNETKESLTNCYHSRVIYNSSYTEEHYYKKGLGDLFLWGGFKLYNAKIN